MNYQENSHKRERKFSNAFYIIITICILILGGVAWFALSNIGKEENPKEYPDNSSSYIESVPDISVPDMSVPDMSMPSVETTPTTESETEIPYESPPVGTNKKDAVSFKMAVDGEIVKDFSDTTLIFSKTFGDMRLHFGTDIACADGTSVSACSDGEVLSVEKDGNLGNVVIVKHGDYTVKYASLKDIKVKVGDKVKMGDILGKTETIPFECEDTPHLHIEAYKDNKPISILKAFGVE